MLQESHQHTLTRTHHDTKMCSHIVLTSDQWPDKGGDSETGVGRCSGRASWMQLWELLSKGWRQPRNVRDLWNQGLILTEPSCPQVLIPMTAQRLCCQLKHGVGRFFTTEPPGKLQIWSFISRTLAQNCKCCLFFSLVMSYCMVCLLGWTTLVPHRTFLLKQQG